MQSGYNADCIINYAGLSYTTSGGQLRRGTYGITRLLNISTLGAVSSRNNALFIQDIWTVRPNLTLNLGLRAEHERVPNFGSAGVENPIEFNYGEKLAPRLGFSYDPFSAGRKPPLWQLLGARQRRRKRPKVDEGIEGTP